MDNIGTTYGLALTSGINAYLPLLSVTISVRWFHLFKLNPNFAFITQDGFIVVLVILAIVDIIADKIPIVDSIWDSIHTVLRPISGAIVAGATGSTITPAGLPAALILGAILATMGHVTKAVTRLTASVSTMGCANAGISLAEDIVVVVAIFLALFAPVIMLALSIVFTVLFVVFAPLLFSALNYRLRLAFSILSWFVHSYFWRGADSTSLDFLLNLSDSDRAFLHQTFPLNETPLGGVQLLWLRRLNGRGLWGSRRVALPTWFILADGALILYPPSRPYLTQVVPFSGVQALSLDQGLLMGSLRLLNQNGVAYNFTVLRNALDTTVDLVDLLHMRHRLPSGATTRMGTIRTRPTGPQRI